MEGILPGSLGQPAPENLPDLTEQPSLGIRAGHVTMVKVKRQLKALKNRKTVWF